MATDSSLRASCTSFHSLQTKARYLSDSLLQLKKVREARTSSGGGNVGALASSLLGRIGGAGSPQHLKVLIFTQFRIISNSVGDRLLRKFGQSAIAEYFGSGRAAELER